MKTRHINRRIVICFLIIFVASACSDPPPAPPIRAQKGVLDLSSWDFDKDGILELAGEWEFYISDRQLTPEDFMGPVKPEISGYLSEGTITWLDHGPHDQRLSAGTYATFRMRIKIKSSQHPPVMELNNSTYYYAHFLWLDNKLVSRGSLHDEKSLSERMVHFHPANDTIELIFQPLLFYHRLNGLKIAIRIGPQKAFMAQWDRERAFKTFSATILLFMGCYHLVLYIFRRKDPSTLYFGIYCLLCIFQVTHKWIYTLFPDIEIAYLYKIDQITIIFSMSAMFFFIRSLFPDETPVRLPGVYLALALMLSLLELSSGWLLSVGRAIFPFYMISLMPPIVFIVARAVAHNRPTARLIFSGGIILMLCGVNDILYGRTVINTGWYFSSGLLVFICFQACALALRFSRAFTMAEDLTEELGEKNIALSRMDKIKDEFLANTSHELRTPLHGIIGIAESLIAGGAGRLPEKATANLSMIFSSAKRLAGLVNDILDFSRLKNRDIKLTPKPVDINPLIQLALEITRPLAGNKELTLAAEIPDDLPPVLADENRLQQILYNLIGNAVKVTEKGEIRIGASQKDTLVEIWISDTGIGIPEDQLDQIFNAFEQVDSSPARQFEGTGLGLSIVRHIVTLHGGDIRVKSTLGKGSTFFFTLPVSTGRPETNRLDDTSGIIQGMFENHTAPDHPLPVVRTPQPSYQVLVVDDDAVNLQVVANHLSLEAISFATASDGVEALKRIESGETPRIVLLDIMMPKMTGYEVCRRLRETFSPSQLPIIMLTAKPHVADLVEGYKTGANDYLSKPFSRDELIARVTCQLSLKEAYETIMENQRLESEIEQQTREKESARLREEKAKLEKLRYQLNPHFLFNALASIRGAVLRDKDAAHKMITHLAEFSRLALSLGSMDTLTVAREIEIIGHYLSMEQMRFGEYLQVSIEMDPATESLQIPAFIIQPLVENAIKYGSRTSPDTLELKIAVRTPTPDTLTLDISNTGAWFTHGTTDRKDSTGTGIKNVRQRLKKYYHSEYRYDKHAGNGHVSCKITVPQVIPGSSN